MLPEFDIGSRIHYHGIIYVKDWMAFHKGAKSFRDNMGYCKADPCKQFKNHLRAVIYMHKHYTKEMAKQFPPIMKQAPVRKERLPTFKWYPKTSILDYMTGHNICCNIENCDHFLKNKVKHYKLSLNVLEYL